MARAGSYEIIHCPGCENDCVVPPGHTLCGICALEEREAEVEALVQASTSGFVSLDPADAILELLVALDSAVYELGQALRARARGDVPLPVELHSSMIRAYYQVDDIRMKAHLFQSEAFPGLETSEA